MKVNQMVMLVGSDGYMPPFGSTGTIVGIEEDGEYRVLFPGHACPALPGDWWIAPGSWLMPIDPDDKLKSEDRELELTT
jgi:hypothetical protein